MKTFKNLFIATMLTATTVLPIALPGTAQATPPGQSHTQAFYVYYRTCPHSPWVCYGGYYHQNDANQAVNWFRSSGYDAFYR